MIILYKETVVRWVAVRVDDDNETDDPSQWEDSHRETVMEEIKLNGWDGEDVLESAYEKIEDD